MYGKSKRYSMHDMLRDVCIRKCDEDKFLNGHNKFTFSNPRRMSFHTSDELEDVNDSTESMSLSRSVICVGFDCAEFPSGAFLAARLLRVLNLMDMGFSSFPTEIFELVNLRFLSVNCDFRIPRGISKLWNLQSLYCYSWFDEPAELWKLSELRYLEVFAIELLKDEEMNYSVLKKLQRIPVNLRNEEATTWDGFLKSIPNIKKLSILDYLRTTPTPVDLSRLHKLENLTCIQFLHGFSHRFRIIFPSNLRKLLLYECGINSGAWRTLCALHKLEMLMIGSCSFKSKEETSDEDWDWELGDGDVFRSLQVLHLEDLRIVRWIADETNFPRLRHLHIRYCSKLEEIPSGIGEIPTLQFIDLEGCRESAAASAERIEVEQSENGNDDLKLHIVRD